LFAATVIADVFTEQINDDDDDDIVPVKLGANYFKLKWFEQLRRCCYDFLCK